MPTFDLQGYHTWMGGGVTPTFDELIQPQKDWANTEGFIRAAIDSRVVGIDSCTLHIETAVNREGPWSDLDILSAVGDSPVFADTVNGASAQLQRWLRWRLERPDDPTEWYACFRISVTLK